MGVQMRRVKMKKRKINSMKFLNEWKKVLSDFNEKGYHTAVFPEDVLRAGSEDRIVFHSPKSKVVFGTIWKDIPLVIILLIHPQKPAVEIIHFENEKAKAFLGTDDSISYPKDAPPVTPEEIRLRTNEVLAMAFPKEIVESLLSDESRDP
jgi:hypothetical protein